MIKTKIVATMGPASEHELVLSKMIKAGLNVCRLNFSHGSHEEHQKIIDTIRKINTEEQTHVGILADLQGPKIRIGKTIEGGIELKAKHTIRLITKECVGDENQVYISYQEFPKDVQAGEHILLDDGKLSLRVLETNRKDSVLCEVVHGGLLTSRKGVNLPNTKVSLPSLTAEDRINLDFALNNNIEWIGLSFVRSAEDIVELRQIIDQKKSMSRIIAKIEKPEAIENIDAIIEVSDGIMVARGDLGVEMPMQEVPILQKMIVKKCHQKGKPVIIATQMLESMITTPRPTRAEVNDVANSVLDGADAVMLSGETSVGHFPIEVIETMFKIIKHAEHNHYPYNNYQGGEYGEGTFLSNAICNSACFLAEQTKAKGIVAMTFSGYTAFQIAKHRPNAHIFVFTAKRQLLTALSLLWGVKGFFYTNMESTDKSIRDTKQMLKDSQLLQTGDVIIHTASIPIEDKARTNMLKVSQID